MKKYFGILFVFAVATISIGAQSQSAEKNKALRPKASELKLRIIPSKETYVLHERPFTKTEFFNLTDKTLCFPEPARDCEETWPGSLITTGEAVVTGEGEQFICHADSRGRSREELLTDIEQHWIKIAPNATYIVKSSEVQVDLSVSGPWRLNAIYRPPEAAFGDAAKFRAELQSAAQNFGCTVPEIEVRAKPATVSVVPPPEQKQSIK